MAQRDARPPFAAIDGAVPPEFSALPTPCYLLDEAALTRNAEILFVNEFGKQGQSARPAVHDANEASAEATTRAEFEVYDRWLKSKNL